MKITSATYATGCYGEPQQTVTISRQGDAVVAVIKGQTLRFRAVELLETDLSQEAWDELRALAALIYGSKNGRANCTNSMFRDLRDVLESFA